MEKAEGKRGEVRERERAKKGKKVFFLGLDERVFPNEKAPLARREKKMQCISRLAFISILC